MIKLVVCDIDGTLLEKGASVLSEETADAPKSGEKAEAEKADTVKE